MLNKLKLQRQDKLHIQKAAKFSYVYFDVESESEIYFLRLLLETIDNLEKPKIS